MAVVKCWMGGRIELSWGERSWFGVSVAQGVRGKEGSGSLWYLERFDWSSRVAVVVVEEGRWRLHKAVQ